MIIVVMGVSGSGKSTLGRALARALRWAFIEGDDFHPPHNIEKMRRGEPLNDGDRAPWLAELHRYIAGLDRQGRNAVLSCSALKQSYRAVLSRGIQELRFVFLGGDSEVIRARLRAREAHFIPVGLLDSQIATLETPEDAIFVDIELSTARQVEQVLRALRLESNR